MKPPLIVGDAPACLEALAAKKESFSLEKQKTPTKEVECVVSSDRQIEPISVKDDDSSPKTKSPPYCNDVTYTTQDSVSSIDITEVLPVGVTMTPPLMTNHIDDSNICDKTNGESCQLVTSSPSQPPPVIIVSRCADSDAETMPNGLELKRSRNVDIELDSSFLPKICNGILTNGDDKQVPQSLSEWDPD